MSVSQYQRKVNELDKDIAQLEEKKARLDKKAADEKRKAANVSVSKNASASTIRNKMRQVAGYEENARKASKDSADLQKKIADKQKKRNDAYKSLQNEQAREDRKEKKAQEKKFSDLQKSYESRIRDIEKISIPASVAIQENGEDATEFDVFVSHAWEDKEAFVDGFVRELEALGIRVWYDTAKMKWGDSMRQKIDDGLKNSRFGVAILSPNYIADGKYWTKAELNGLFQLETINGKTLLPIWHGLTKQEIIDFSPLIAGKKAMSTATMTAGEIAAELKNLLDDIDKE